MSDEIYERLVYDGAKHVSIASLSKEAHDLTITINSFSQSYAMTGWRLRYMAAPKQWLKRLILSRTIRPLIPHRFALGACRVEGDQQPLADMREFDMCNYMFDRISRFRTSAVKPRAHFILVNISRWGSLLKISPTAY